MFTHRRLLCALLCAAALAASISAAETHAGDVLCFSPSDFGEAITGVCITAVPEEGSLLLGSRRIRPGDVLTAAQLSGLTFRSHESEADAQATLRYLPIHDGGVSGESELTIAVFGRKNLPPTAEDSKMETYKNLPNEGLLQAADPEGGALTFTLTRAPKRGEVILRDDGSFLYTPAKNKVGTDSFAYTAADNAGNVSPEATVTVDILKPSDDRRYTDTAADCRFEAEWLRNTGIFSGETVNGQFCFSPDESVSRGQFLAMLMQVLELPVDRSVEETAFLDDSPQWLRPYLSAALRSGIITGYPAGGGVEFRPEQAVTASEAALMVHRALDFALPAASIDLPEEAIPLTRADAAKALYQISLLRRENGGLFGLFR
ncbi:MAG: S-layer homology domain-containing protein [Oscillospiraceae bacterium]|nr:S-layer homology domain-containing protein [Oscillospiraceae bacterium]